MEFDLEKSIEILECTPQVLSSYLSGLSNDWIRNNEGEHTWSTYDIVGHLIFGEKTDWVPRAKIILSYSEDKTFTPFDRFAQFNEDQNRTIDDLLEEFSTLRVKNINTLKALNISNEDLKRTGIHPEFGEVTLEHHLAAWTVHDLGHIAQISRVMAKQYKPAVGPWTAYMGILNKK